jgi:LIVCS family branched-chain amino acid:cation transporter
MKPNKFFTSILTIGFALFSMFFGAGNVIFPPYLGLQCGRMWFGGFAAYYVADVLLAVLALFALLQVGSSKQLMERLGKEAAVVLMTVIILCIGPLLAIPRTAATTYELGIGELLPSVSPVLFSVLFFALILALSIRESSVIDIIGKFLTPALLLGLAVMILVGMFHPIGQVSDTVQVESVLETGIEAGYQTLDVLAALVFGAVLVKSAEEKGYHEEKSRRRVLVGASVVAGGLLLLVYLGLAWLGASASEVYPPDISRASLVISIVQRLLGRPGLVLFSVVVALACITTAVGLVSSTADHFATISGRKLSYRLCVIVICVFSALVSNLGLDTIISVAAPILGLVYPPVLVLVAVSLVMPHMSNSICISAVLGALLMSVLSTADSLGLAMPWLHRMPLANVDMAWILPSVLCGVAAFLYRLPWLERAED